MQHTLSAAVSIHKTPNKQVKQINSMKNYIFILAFLLTLLDGCKKNDVKDNVESCYSNSNVQTIVHDGINREYVLYSPNSYNGTSSLPVLLNFHGFGGSASKFMNEADMRAVAESDPFILVYPQGSCLNGSSHWNACPSGGNNKSNADDFDFAESIISEISSQYNVDMERIYAVGYSNGGMMAYGLANYKSDLIAAVASVSGVMLDCLGSTNHPMPVVHLHGTSDDVIPYDGNSDFNSAQNTVDHWINFNNTITTPTVSSDNSGGMSIEHFAYTQGDQSVAVEHYKFIEGEHVWFNATYQGQNTAELIWNFVSKYDINGLR
jgi:polyhydroxybutyrate depolymerase